MTDAISTSAAARDARRWAVLAATLLLWLCAACGAQADPYVIDDFESGTPFSLFAPGAPPSTMPFPAKNVQTGLPVFSGIREAYAYGGFSTAGWGSTELTSTPGDDGLQFSGVGGSGAVWYRNGYHGMDFDALAKGDRFYVKLSEDPGAEVRFSFALQDQVASYVIGVVSPDGSGYLELPFAAWPQDFPDQPDFHHVSGFGLQASFFGSSAQPVTITEFGITSVPEPGSAVLLAAGALALLLRRRTMSRRLQ